MGLLVVMGERDVGLPEIERTIQLSHDPGLEVYPAISPDGKMIAYAAGPVGDMHVYVQQIEGGRRIAVTETPGNYIWPQWSPDGSRIAFEVVKAPSYEIHVVPSLGGAARLVFEASDNEISGFAWAPRRRAISDLSEPGNIHPVARRRFTGNAYDDPGRSISSELVARRH